MQNEEDNFHNPEEGKSMYRVPLSNRLASEEILFYCKLRIRRFYLNKVFSEIVFVLSTILCKEKNMRI